MISSKNFNNIRFIAVFFILALHSIFPNIELIRLGQIPSFKEIDYFQLINLALYANIFKAGTIIFFIISGFLFEMQIDKINKFNAFLKKKTNSLLFPYFIIFFIPTMFLVGFIEPYIGVKEDLSIYLFIKNSFTSIFLTNYWFVPALFITLMINYFIKTKDILKSLIVFVPIWLFTYINIYLKFTNSSHTVWFIGFLFIFSIGRLMFIHNNQIAEMNVLRNKKTLILLVIISYIISNIESIFIVIYGQNLDYLNTLRIGNIAYSFFLFYLLNYIFSNRKITLPFDLSFYFIYLIHPFVLRVAHFLLSKYDLINFEYPSQVFYNIAYLIYTITICIVLHNLFFKLRIKSFLISDYVFNKKAENQSNRFIRYSILFISWMPKRR